MKLIIVATVVISVVSAAALSAQEVFFADGARSLSLGRAFVGLADDENTLHYNPAGVAGIQELTIGVSGIYQRYSWEIESLLSDVQPNYSERRFSVSCIYRGMGISYSVGGHGWWDEVELWRTVYDPEPLTVKTVYYEHIVGATYARSVRSGFSVGVTGRYIHSVDPFDDTPAEALDLMEKKSGVSFDVGVLYAALDNLSLGLSAGNLVSSHIGYVVHNDFGSSVYLNELPINISFGLAFLPHRSVTLAADVRNLFEDEVPDAANRFDYTFKRSFHVGCEWRPVPEVAIRAGYFNSHRFSELPGYMTASPVEYNSYHNVTFGLGLRYRNYRLDIGAQMDNRKSKMEESTVRLRNTTAKGVVSLAVAL